MRIIFRVGLMSAFKLMLISRIVKLISGNKKRLYTSEWRTKHGDNDAHL